MIYRFLIILFSLLNANAAKPQNDQTERLPNVLWVLTDDQRYDSIQAFNRILHDRDHSELGYVESPQTDRLAAMGTTFINTYCQAMGCAPSRASMHYGRYPFRSGIYEFEYHNNNAEHTRPSLPESMASLGYQTLHVGKLGVRIKTRIKSWTQTHKIYQTDIDFRTLSREGLCDWGKNWISQINGEKLSKPFPGLEFFVTPEGKFEYCSLELEKMRPEFAGTTAATIGKYDLLRHFNPKKGKAIDKGMIIAGVSPRKAGKTRDGYYSSVFADYLKSPDRKFKVGTKTFDGVDTSKPLFAHIGYDFPHTPVLPPADYRARFQKLKYKIPQIDPRELKNMPAQLKRQVAFGQSDHLTDAQKLTMIQDYYAFCAYGDTLVGQATDAFIEYSKQQKQPWMIVYVCGDHGWKLNEHGSISKFTPWDLDSHNPIIVVSSDKQAFPAGKVVTDFTEFVDIAPTILAAGGASLQDKQYNYLDGHDLAKIASGKVPARDYVIGESHAVTGPRAYIRTKEYVFSMQTRPDRNRGKNMQWALTADYQDLDPALYHMPTDPHEVNNLAFSKKHQRIAQALKEKLTKIVLGDNRVEISWGPKADGTNIHRSNFAPGTHDGKLKLSSLSRASAAEQHSDGTARSPNIVFIMADDLGLGDVSFHARNILKKKPLFETPVIDSLAKQGLWFTDGHSATSLCAPTRYAVMSGNNNYRSYAPPGVWSTFGRTAFKPGEATLGSVVRDAGYRTGFVGKWHLGGDFRVPGSDNIYRGYKGGDITGKVDMTRIVSGGPKYCGFDYDFTTPCGIQGPIYLLYENQQWYPLEKDSRIVFLNKENARFPKDVSDKGPGPGDSRWDTSQLGKLLSKKAADFIRASAKGGKPFFLYYCSPMVHVPHRPPATFDGRKIKGSTPSDHLDMVLDLEQQIKRIVDALKETDNFNNTLFVLTSDNGGLQDGKARKLGYLPGGGWKSSKNSPHEGGHRVPFFAVWPGHIKPGITGELAVNQDMVATFAALVGTKIPDGEALDSHNLLPLLTDKGSFERREFFVQQAGANHELMFRKMPWKLIIQSNNKRTKFDPIGLYNLKKDPGEEYNLILNSDFKARADNMLKEYLEIIESRHPTAPGRR